MHEEFVQIAYDLLQTNIPAEFIFKYLIDFTQESLSKENPDDYKAMGIRAAAIAYREAYEKANEEWREELRKQQEKQEQSGGTRGFYLAPMAEHLA